MMQGTAQFHHDIADARTDLRLIEAWYCSLQCHPQPVFGTFLWDLMDMCQHVPAHVRQNDTFRAKVVFVGAELRVI